jgi:hypothetical protein
MLDKGFVEDNRLSWKSKGILTYLLSKPDGWKVIVKDIVKHGIDGERAVYSALKELKKYGYYHKYPVREGQRIVRWDSIICECPEEYQEDIKNIIEKNKEVEKEPKPIVKAQDSLLCGFVDVENEDVDFVDVENVEHSNIYISKELSNQKIISIYPGESETEMPVKQPTPVQNNNDMIDINADNISEAVADKICLDELKDEYTDKHEEIDLLNDIIVETLSNKAPDATVRVSKQNIPIHTAQQAFMRLSKQHIKYVIDSLNNNDNKYKITKNTKSYLMTALFHAPRTIAYYYDRTFSKQKEPSQNTFNNDDLLRKLTQKSLKFGEYAPKDPATNIF